MERELVAELGAVDRLEAEGDLVGALDLLSSLRHQEPSIEVLTRLVGLRRDAALAYPAVPRSPWPPVFEDPFPEIVGRVPEIRAADLTSELMGATIAHHGSILVRGLFDHDQIARTSESIIGATDARAADVGRTDANRSNPAYYRPTLGLDPHTKVLRQLVSRSNGVWLCDSPASLAQVIDDLSAAGVVDAVAEHFGERPCITLQKSTLRRSAPEFKFASWHQDGSFLGADTRAVNVWVSLTECGGDRPAPGLELIPGRIPELFPADGGTGNASINGFAVHLYAKQMGLASATPEFDPGDALFFDELMAHRTHLTETMTRERLALECWFFAPSRPAEDYVPLLV